MLHPFQLGDHNLSSQYRDTSRETTIAAVLKHGWKLVLLGPRSKRPIGASWNVTDDPQVIRDHKGNIGLTTGQSGTAALDFDDLDAMNALFNELGPLPIWVETGSHKFHCYALNDPDLPAKIRFNSRIVGEVQRGNLQQVVMPGDSIHPNTGDQYTWLLDPVNTELLPLPDNWKQYLIEANNPIGQPAVGTIASVMPILTQEEKEVNLPRIIVRAGDLPRIVDEAEMALAGSPLPIYQRGGDIVRPIRIDNDLNPDESIRRPPGALIITTAHPAWLKESMIRTAQWLSYSERDKVYIVRDPSIEVVSTLMARKEWRFPILKSVSAAPTLAFDGRIIEREGYDPLSGLLLDFGGVKFDRIPENPTKHDAREALNFLLKPLRLMPWASQADRSVAASALLTVMVRATINAAPLHMFDSPVPGSGKSMLADCIGILKTGGKPPSVSQGSNEEEDEKRLSAVLAKADPVILLDNCSKPLNGDFLCSVLTQPVVSARILGLSEMRNLPTTSFIIATGNNMITSGDTFRRVVLCTLDPKCERPEERKFDFNPVEEYRVQRANLVVAALTILRAYRVAGSPLAGSLTPMGSFEDWSWIRETLSWLDEADPALTRQTVLSNDSLAQELEQIMTSWEKEFGDRVVVVSDITPMGPTGTLLHEATNKNDWSPKSVGRWLLRHKNRVKSNKAFRISAKKGGTTFWVLDGAQAKLRISSNAHHQNTSDHSDDGDVPF
jgi:hypothetical protein